MKEIDSIQLPEGTFRCRDLDARNELKTISNTVDGITKSVSDVKTEISTISESLSDVESDVSIVTNNVSSLKSDVTTLKKTVSSLSSSSGSSEATQLDLAELKVTVANIESNMSSLETDVNNIQTSIKSAASDISSLESKVSTINTTVSNVKSDMSTLGETVDKISSSSNSVDIFTCYNQYPNAKNSIARGKDITEYYEDGSLYTRIANDFDDLFVGDYFVAHYHTGYKTFRIAGFNLAFQYNMIDTQTNHITIVPDTSLMNSGIMNGTDTTEGGYYNSYMCNKVIGSATTTVDYNTVNGRLYDLFGSHLMRTTENVPYIVSTKYNSGGLPSVVGMTETYASIQTYAVLLSEVELCGTQIYSSSGANVGNYPFQLPLFKLMPYYITNTMTNYWLRDVASSTSFSMFNIKRVISQPASVTLDAVRPRFTLY